MSANDDLDLWTAHEAAAYLKRSRSTFYRLTQLPDFPASRSPGGGDKLWVAGEVRAWALRQITPAAA